MIRNHEYGSWRVQEAAGAEEIGCIQYQGQQPVVKTWDESDLIQAEITSDSGLR